MFIRSAARALCDALERKTGRLIYKEPPRGSDLWTDARKLLPHFSPSVVFDVGANVGQSAEVYVERFPSARIYCFEPVTKTYETLRAHLAGQDNARCVQTALGAGVGEGTMRVDGPSDMAALLSDADQPSDAVVEAVPVSTVDQFMADEGLDHVGFLKIDTEGHDLDVLKGAERALADQRIDMIQVEAGMNPDNTWHVPLEELCGFLRERDYALFGLYEQQFFWSTGEPHLLRSDAVLISRRLIARNKRS